jgi:hypothetical protein
MPTGLQVYPLRGRRRCAASGRHREVQAVQYITIPLLNCSGDVTAWYVFSMETANQCSYEYICNVM